MGCKSGHLYSCRERMNSPLVFCVVRVAQSLVFYVMFCRPFSCILVLVRLAIVQLSVLPFTVYDYLFGILKLFLQIINHIGKKT